MSRPGSFQGGFVPPPGYYSSSVGGSNRIVRVPATFARALLDDWRVPPYDDERESITDPEQLAYEEEIDACLARWMSELDGEGDRTVIVPLTGPGARWFSDELAGSVLDGLTLRLPASSTEERERIVSALAGWTYVMSQFDPD
jgi:hypothetical protein